MIERMWFVLENEVVFGPYRTDEVEMLLQQKPHLLVWGKALSEWLGQDLWKSAVDRLKMELPNHTPSEKAWRHRVEGRESDLMTYDDLINFLKTRTDFGSIEVWSEKGGKWKEIYSFPSIAEDLGVTRRAHPRVPIMGSLQADGQKGSFKGRLLSISEGGFGMSSKQILSLGERFKGIVSSPNLFVTIKCSCEVVYIGQDGFVGVRFTGIPVESKSAIIEYVNKFSDPD
ncbi:MAG TPA: PilZ domain-containing protein [Pseudobdellovibrionaceae bacterium]|nr:PilZ domain-containing protein [Pseudobdellovibrionaceae bacterium]